MNTHIQSQKLSHQSDNYIRSLVEGITNKPITEPSGEKSVQIRYNEQLHYVDILTSIDERREIKQLDDEEFGPYIEKMANILTPPTKS